MSTITLPNIRVGSDLQVRVRLKDGGVAIDWSTLQNIKACIYSDAQRALAGRCGFSIDEEDSTLLVCTYAANKPQYLGVNRIVISAKYMGETKTYDKPAFTFVRWTADQEGEEITIDDPDVDVEIEVEDVSSSLLDQAIAAALAAAAAAEHAAHLIPNQVLLDAEAATVAANAAADAANAAGITSAQVSIADNEPGTPSAEVSLANKVLSIIFHHLKGNTGDAAGFGSITATVDDVVGDPSVTVTVSGPDTAKNFTFAFHGLRGIQGVPGVANAKYKSVDTLPTASAATMDFIYLTPSGTTGVYNMSYTEQDGSTYSWQDLGTTAIQLSDYATKAEVSQLEAEVGDLDDCFDEIIHTSPNLYDKTKRTDDYYYWIYGPQTNSSYCYSDFIPVVPGKTYSFQNEISNVRALRNMNWIVGFDENKNKKSAASFSNVSTYTVPEGIHYIIFTIAKVTDSNASFVEGAELQDYVPYFDPYSTRILKAGSNNDTHINGLIDEKLSAFTPTIPDDSIGIDKVSFAHSINRFNKDASDVLLGYYIAGSPSADPQYNSSGFIKVSPGETLYSAVTYSAYPYSLRFINYYKEDKTYISYEENKSQFTIPANCHYIRFSVLTTYWNNLILSGVGYLPFSAYGKKIAEEYLPDSSMPSVCLPRKVYNLDGEQNNVYFKDILSYIPDGIVLSVEGWEHWQRCGRTNGTTEQFKLSIRSKKTMAELATFAMQSVKGLPSTDNGQIVLNCIGDSFTYNGKWFDQVNTLCPSLSFVGMRKSYNANSAIRAEGRGGWTLDNYYTRVHGTGVLSGFSPFIHPVGYKYYGVTGFWKRIVNDNIGDDGYDLNGYDDYKTWFGTDGKKLNPSANDLMWDSDNSKYIFYNGSAWEDVSGTLDFVFDYAKYVDVWQISSPDYVIIMLGVNDWFSVFNDASVETWNERMSAVIESIQDYADSVSKSIKIGICTNTTISSLPNNSYKSAPDISSRRLWNGRKNTIENFDSAENEADGVYVIDTGATLDPDYGFDTAERLPFVYYTGTAREIYDTNGVHPSTDGYKQLGTCVAGFIQATR